MCETELRAVRRNTSHFTSLHKIACEVVTCWISTRYLLHTWGLHTEKCEVVKCYKSTAYIASRLHTYLYPYGVTWDSREVCPGLPVPFGLRALGNLGRLFSEKLSRQSCEKETRV